MKLLLPPDLPNFTRNQHLSRKKNLERCCLFPKSKGYDKTVILNLEFPG